MRMGQRVVCTVAENYIERDHRDRQKRSSSSRIALPLEDFSQRLKPWAPSMGPEPWHPYIPTIYHICTLKGP